MEKLHNPSVPEIVGEIADAFAGSFSDPEVQDEVFFRVARALSGIHPDSTSDNISVAMRENPTICNLIELI